MTTIAFEAFRCYDFGPEGRWLEADVALECDGPAYTRVFVEAWVAGLLYPLGLILLNAALLLPCRRALLKQRHTDFTKAIGFLHREFEPPFFWWSP